MRQKDEFCLISETVADKHNLCTYTEYYVALKPTQELPELGYHNIKQIRLLYCSAG